MRYLLFAGDKFEAKGGWDDLQGSYETLEEAMQPNHVWTNGWGEIVDLQTLTKIMFWNCGWHPCEPPKVGDTSCT